jgi:hypothetical protein
MDAGINACADQHHHPDQRVNQPTASDCDVPPVADQCAHKSASANGDAHADMDGYVTSN